MVGQPAVFEAVMHDCVDRCTFTWSVDGAFRVTRIDESDDKTRNDLAAIGGGVRFEALSRISLLLPAGRHIVSVHIVSATTRLSICARP
ncbi:MAG: hypothetical protein H0U58_05320 [Chloroflexi bacterium]|nr:hypothetical protein [Chloroflexota bacterium]